MRGVFVTGTDTGVGKTVVSAALVSAFRRDRAVGYWKPIQTGIEEDDDTTEAARLASCSPEEIFPDGIRLERPLSPHLSARLANFEITLENLAAMQNRLSPDRFWIVEGAGGLLVPLNDSAMIADLIEALRLPVVVASRAGLGTINHTLLTVEALRRRNLKIAGVVMVGEPNSENRRAIEAYGKVKVLGEIPHLETVSPSAIAEVANGWVADRISARWQTAVRW